jgi:SPASM domain peptide maturase of grasp-with-spasm system
MLPDSVFRLFASCIPVRGARRSTICDVQRGAFHLIPNGLYEILTEHRDRTAREVVAHYGDSAAEVIEEYYQFLLENELGFWCDEPQAFPPLDLSWEAPELVSNAVIDVGPASRHDYPRLLAELDDLGCKALQLRFFRPCARDELWELMERLAGGRLRGVDVVMPWAPHWDMAELERLCFAHQRVCGVVLHSAPEDAALRVRGLQIPVTLTRQVIGSASHCGQVHPGYFVVNLAAFTEAQRHNSCLNGKIAVDEHGEIRNCPSMPRSFGNAARTSLHAALTASGFRDAWKISKDRVETCRDCEFRYVCTDCRAFVRTAGDAFAKPATCAYDPYTATWEVPAPPAAAPLEKARAA